MPVLLYGPTALKATMLRRRRISSSFVRVVALASEPIHPRARCRWLATTFSSLRLLEHLQILIVMKPAKAGGWLCALMAHLICTFAEVLVDGCQSEVAPWWRNRSVEGVCLRGLFTGLLDGAFLCRLAERRLTVGRRGGGWSTSRRRRTKSSLDLGSWHCRWRLPLDAIGVPAGVSLGMSWVVYVTPSGNASRIKLSPRSLA